MADPQLPSSLPASGPSPVGHAVQARRVLLISLAVTAALFVLPGGGVVGYPLLLLSTFVHEMGHGLAAILVGGDFVSLRVFGDGSGVAFSATDGGAFKRAIVSGGGLVGPAIAAAVGFTLGRRARPARLTLLIGGLLVIVASLLWVRSLVGWFVALGLIVVSLGVGLLRREHWSQLLVVFLSVQMGLSVFSRSEYLFSAGAQTGAGGGRSDSAAIADALIGPYWFWGGVCGLVSVLVLAYGAWIFLRSARSVNG